VQRALHQDHLQGTLGLFGVCPSVCYPLCYLQQDHLQGMVSWAAWGVSCLVYWDGSWCGAGMQQELHAFYKGWPSLLCFFGCKRDMLGTRAHSTQHCLLAVLGRPSCSACSAAPPVKLRNRGHCLPALFGRSSLDQNSVLLALLLLLVTG
jgi:hypothetical protein